MRGARCENCLDFTPVRTIERPTRLFGATEQEEFGWNLGIREDETRLDFCSWACLAAYATEHAKVAMTEGLLS